MSKGRWLNRLVNPALKRLTDLRDFVGATPGVSKNEAPGMVVYGPSPDIIRWKNELLGSGLYSSLSILSCLFFEEGGVWNPDYWAGLG